MQSSCRENVSSCPQPTGAAEAIAEYVDLNAWQVAEIEKAIEEADAGDFADEKEVAETFSKWSE